MARPWIGLGLASLVGLLVASAPPSALPKIHESYAQNPPLAHTGGFGEPTCHACHFDQPLNAEGGALSLEGVPDSFNPGRSYPLIIQLIRSGMERGGFQLSIRDSTGTQAGSLSISETDRTTLSIVDLAELQYAYHTLTGTELTAPDTIRWLLTWRAPAKPIDVVFHVAANAANYDASEFGDFVYTIEERSNASSTQE